jgi:hypothetical protein
MQAGCHLPLDGFGGLIWGFRDEKIAEYGDFSVWVDLRRGEIGELNWLRANQALWRGLPPGHGCERLIFRRYCGCEF